MLQILSSSRNWKTIYDNFISFFFSFISLRKHTPFYYQNPDKIKLSNYIDFIGLQCSLQRENSPLNIVHIPWRGRCILQDCPPPMQYRISKSLFSINIGATAKARAAIPSGIARSNRGRRWKDNTVREIRWRNGRIKENKKMESKSLRVK